jgi:glycine cleavage system H protein
MLRYSKDHTWIRVEGEHAYIGITAYAQQQLGDIVYVDLPKPGAAIRARESMGTVESVKSVSELFPPISGVVEEVNPVLADAPEKLNEDPEGAAWMVRVRITEPAELDALLDADAYRRFVEGGG